MTQQEYTQKLEALKVEFTCKQKELMLSFARANNPYKVGDTVTDHIGSIEIEKIEYALYSYISGFPCAVYNGVELLKNGKPNKKMKKRAVWQPNVKQD